ncbi:ABC transporter permease [Streptomyces cucumeris]|uniref:ABC transporter permease n=1 Tax=Streptomyces cucumeris TaxID=2962890 RepID=UPI003D71A349
MNPAMPGGLATEGEATTDVSAAGAGSAPRAGRAPLPIVLAVVLAVVQLLVLIAFAWPAARSGPSGVPVVVAGDGPAAAALQRHIEQSKPGGFDIAHRKDEAKARAALLDREAYAAVVVGGKGQMKVLVASAASAAISSAFRDVAADLGEKSGNRVPVEDVQPAPAKDPHGAAFASSVLPVVLTSLLGGILFTLKLRQRRSRAVAALAFAAVAGLATTALAHGWIGALNGAYLGEASVVALMILAISATVAGLGNALGHAGMALGALTMLLIGNPFSGVAAAPEMLPTPWGDLGQLLPPGAGATLLRSVTFFDGAGAGRPLTVLLIWAACGLALLAVRARGNTHTPASP